MNKKKGKKNIHAAFRFACLFIDLISSSCQIHFFCHQCNRENGMKLNAKKHVKTVNIDFSCEYERLLLAWKSFILSFSVRIMYKACAEQKTHLSSTRKAFSTHSIVKQFGWKIYSVHIMNRQIYHSMLYASRSFTF